MSQHPKNPLHGVPRIFQEAIIMQRAHGQMLGRKRAVPIFRELRYTFEVHPAFYGLNNRNTLGVSGQ
jgi:hypothetical protein